MRNLNRIEIIGAGAAGLTTAETLRRLGFQGTIMMVHAEHTLPYDRPPLSKQVLAGTWAPEKVHLRSPAALEKLALDWFHGVEAIHLDVAAYYEAGERLVAVLGWNCPKQLLSYRQRLLAAYTPFQETNAAHEHQKASGIL
ncbi:FAD-dependent oxidoreductase [Ktedonobacter racemifer]|uniref:FAD-dependent pyridine nucleotide-disulfide oxidoreductase n=1 Tax=Ktedonobacter racemifer DSM 44963 TaxID=485913 RepID=D6TU97_KTERA|nr:FAD-dependent oxidoreductase [Ktedonobacter racemifer]EFH83998.1 FAD-dependent pyridine nucleotide-disulfide oxidoreductase [Ktedonobacter racemifer DSM 44963]